MEKRLYSAAEVSKDTPAAFYLRAFDRNDLLERLGVVYDCNDPDDLPKQTLAERWLRMLSADRLRELADKIARQLMQFDVFSDDVTDAIDDTLLDVITKNANDIEITRPNGMVGYLFPWLKEDKEIDTEALWHAGFSPDILKGMVEEKEGRKVSYWELYLFTDTPVGRLSYCRIRLTLDYSFPPKTLHCVEVDFEHPAASFRKRFDNKVVGARLKRATHGMLWSNSTHSARDAFNDVSDRFMQKREEILGIIREISPEEFV